jgi:nucleoid DNA-binding protein
MVITRENLIKRLANKSGYYEKDIRQVLHCFDDVVLECLAEVTDDEEVSVQIVKGIKCGCKIVAPRRRVDPRDGSPIDVSETVKPFAKFSEDFRKVIQENYNISKDD